MSRRPYLKKGSSKRAEAVLDAFVEMNKHETLQSFRLNQNRLFQLLVREGFYADMKDHFDSVKK